MVALLASGCVGAGHGLYPPREGEAVTPVWVVNHGWHTGIVVRRRDLPENLWPQRDFPEAEFLEVGWGERAFYMAPAGTSGMALRAALWPSASVLHVAGFAGPAERYFPASEIVEIALSRRGFEQLAAFLGEAYATDEAGGAIRLGPGQYPNSVFYLARERYHLFRTCNVWTARALRSGGCPLTAFVSITARNVIDQATAVCGAIRRGRSGRRVGRVHPTRGRDRAHPWRVRRGFSGSWTPRASGIRVARICELGESRAEGGGR